MRWRHACAFTLAALVSALTACGEGAPSTLRPDPSRWLSVDATRHSATIAAIAAYDNAASGFNIDGANKGALLFTVPSGWLVSLHCVNNASSRSYACALIRSPGARVVAPLTARATPEPHPGSRAAATPELHPGSRAAFSFAPGSPTRYRIVATNEGHQPVGMWVTLEVTPSGRPSVRWVR